MEPTSINFPLEIWTQIISYSPRETLAQIDQLNKNFHKLASADYRLYLSKIKLRTDVVQANIQILWNKPEEKYSVDSYGKLTIYSKFNLLSDLIYSYSDTQKIKDAVKLTLEEAYRLAVDKKIFISAKNKSDDWLFDAAATYSDTYPINEVACRLKHSKQFASIEDKTYDLFKQKLFYGYHINFHKENIIPKYYHCHPKTLDFHQAIPHPLVQPNQK